MLSTGALAGHALHLHAPAKIHMTTVHVCRSHALSDWVTGMNSVSQPNPLVSNSNRSSARSNINEYWTNVRKIKLRSCSRFKYIRKHKARLRNFYFMNYVLQQKYKTTNFQAVSNCSVCQDFKSKSRICRASRMNAEEITRAWKIMWI